MNRDDIIRMARESGWAQKDIDSLLYIVETAAAAEREACAKVCDERVGYWQRDDIRRDEDKNCAAAIRARSNP